LLDVLDRQSRHLVRLTDDLLDISRITRNKISLRNEQVELSTILKETIDTFRPACDRGGVQLEAELPSEPVYLSGDSARLAQIFGNLLNNACKFTDKGGRVSVAVERQNGHAVVRVRDTGIGIAPEKIPHIFEMFVQADTSMSRATAGLGIGLTLVKTMVEMHGGSVEAVSHGPGSGSEFIVKLPALDGRAPKDPTPAPMPGERLPRLSILLVDDNADAVAALSMLFRLRGSKAEVAEDAETALRRFDELRPDLVILDIGLPGMDGHHLAREIRRRSHGRDVLLIALSGWGRDEDILRSHEAGCDLHLVKPVEQNELLEQIEKLIAVRKPAFS
jgi:CheY-like chemotaxis protein/two-component sensor histidine kinase